MHQLGRGSLELFQRLPPTGREYFRRAVEHRLQGVAGSGATVEALYSVDYDRVPPTPAVYLDSSDYVHHVACDLFPPWRPHFLHVCDPASNVYEADVTGASGNGKTTWAMLVLSYLLCRLGHLRDPARFYGLQAKSKIVFGLYALTKDLIKEVGYDYLKEQIIDESPFFRDVMRRSPHGKEKITWEDKRLEVICGSSALHAVGKNLFAVVADELNFYAQGEKTASRAHDLVSEVSTRLEGRFIDFGGNIPGIAIYISQTRTTSDYLELRIRHRRSGGKGVVVIRGPRWKFNVNAYKRLAERGRADPSYLGPHPVNTVCGPVPGFRVVVGDEVTDARVLDTAERASDGTYTVQPIAPDEPEPDGRVVVVPALHWGAYDRDLYGALRSIGDEPTGSFTPFFPRKDVVESCFDEELIFPFRSQEIPVYERQSHRLQDFFEHELVTRVNMGRRIPIRHPEAPRYIHLDLSKGGDRTGMVMVHPSAHYHAARKLDEDDDPAQVGESEVLKDIEVDFYLGIKGGPFAEAIDYRKIRVFIHFLRHIGFWIQWCTADQYMCLAGDTRVLTARGLVPIREVESGDVVQTRHGMSPVKQRFEWGKQGVFTVTTRDGESITGTGRHRIEVLTGWDYASEYGTKKDGGGSKRVPKWEWRRFDELAVDDVVRLWDRETDLDGQVSAPLESPHKVELGWQPQKGRRSSIDTWEFPESVTPELAEWLGLFWGDGNFDGADGVCLTVGGDDEVEDAADAFEQLFGVPPKVRVEGGVHRIAISSRWLVRWMHLNGFSKGDIPEAIWRSGRHLQAMFLRGLFATDGAVSAADGAVRLTSAYRPLVEQVQILLRSGFGFESRIIEAKKLRFDDGGDTGELYWHLQIRGAREKFLRVIGFTYTRKVRELEVHATRPGRHIFSRVATIDYDREGVDVFDIEVDGDPSYIANGFVSHNSADHNMRLRDGGFNAELLSTDRTSKPYRACRQVATESRLRMPFPPGFSPQRWGSRKEALERVIMFTELTGLEHDVKRDKVDHRDQNPDGTKGSKDVGDGLAGSIFRCLVDDVRPGQNPQQPTHRRRMQDRLNRYMMVGPNFGNSTGL